MASDDANIAIVPTARGRISALASSFNLALTLAFASLFKPCFFFMLSSTDAIFRRLKIRPSTDAEAVVAVLGFESVDGFFRFKSFVAVDIDGRATTSRNKGPREDGDCLAVDVAG